jgi:hypothetical protein
VSISNFKFVSIPKAVIALLHCVASCHSKDAVAVKPSLQSNSFSYAHSRRVSISNSKFVSVPKVEIALLHCVASWHSKDAVAVNSKLVSIVGFVAASGWRPFVKDKSVHAAHISNRQVQSVVSERSVNLRLELYSLHVH